MDCAEHPKPQKTDPRPTVEDKSKGTWEEGRKRSIDPPGLADMRGALDPGSKAQASSTFQPSFLNLYLDTVWKSTSIITTQMTLFGVSSDSCHKEHYDTQFCVMMVNT